MRQGRFAQIGGTESASGTTRLALTLLPPLVGALVALVVVAQGVHSWTASAGAVAALLVGFCIGAWQLLRPRAASPASGDDARWHGFLSTMEDEGGTWFWETNAEGRLTYLTDSFRAALDSQLAEIILARFADRLRLGDGETLAFHLKSRFPFRGLPVALDRGEEASWLLTGAPRFDAIGRFRGFRGFGVSLTQQRRDAAAADRKARFDSLTGLPNRAHMDALLAEAITNADDRKQSCALFLIDLDRFKAVNDTLGHPVGDVLLQQAARRMTDVIAGDGQVGRVGGDEFKAVFPGIGEEGKLAAIAERLIARVSEPYQIQGHQVLIGASIGISISLPGRTHRTTLVKEADLAVYASKHAGRGTFRFFEPEMHDEENDRAELQADLKHALARQQLKLLYQPVVSVAGETIVGFEALVRWWHPTRGPLGPDEFLGVAAKARQMPALGEWILRTAFAEATHWPEQVRIVVNLAPEQLVAGLPASVVSALAASGLAPARVEFDLHQESLVSADPEVREILDALHRIGVQVALDDFGERGADIAPLRSGGIGRVKLDPGFYRLAATDEGHRLVAGLVRIAREGGLSVTAEGAETLADLEIVRGVGCTDVQGFLFGRPMPAEEARVLTVEARPVSTTGTIQQRGPRHRLIRNGYLSAGGIDWAVRLRNVSSGGAMVECGAELPEGSIVHLDLGDEVMLQATVRWSHDGRVGMQFAQAFDLGRLGPRKREAQTDTPMLQPDYLKGPVRADAPEPEIERLRLQKLRQSMVRHGTGR